MKKKNPLINEKKGIDLTKQLKPYVSGWVAIDQKTRQVVMHAETLSEISQKLKLQKIVGVMLFPAAKKYSRFVL